MLAPVEFVLVVIVLAPSLMRTVAAPTSRPLPLCTTPLQAALPGDEFDLERRVATAERRSR